MILHHTINKPAAIVFEYLSDMQKYVTVHPIIYKISPLGNNRYKVYEKLILPFTYEARVESDIQNKTINISANVMKMVQVHMNFVIEGNNPSRIKETVTFKSFLPVKAIMAKIFTKQHKQLFLNIEKA